MAANDIKVGVNPNLMKNIEANIPVGRAGTPEEAAGAVYLMCIPESNYVSGQVLICGGGRPWERLFNENDKETNMNKVLRTLGVACCAVLTAGFAMAFPDKPVRLIVPYPAGGATDVSARILAEKLGAAWGQPVVVENKPGATGAIGTDLAAKSKADGYTVLLQVPIMIATEQTKPSTTSYRTLRDFVPVSTVFTTPIVFLASDTAPKGDLKAVMAAASTTWCAELRAPW